MFFPFSFKFSRKYHKINLDKNMLYKYVYDRIYHTGQVDKISIQNDKIVFKTEWFLNIFFFNPHIFSGFDNGIIDIFEKSYEIKFEFITWRYPLLLVIIFLIFSFSANIWLALIFSVPALFIQSVLTAIKLNNFVNKIVSEINALHTNIKNT